MKYNSLMNLTTETPEEVVTLSPLQEWALEALPKILPTHPAAPCLIFIILAGLFVLMALVLLYHRYNFHFISCCHCNWQSTPEVSSNENLKKPLDVTGPSVMVMAMNMKTSNEMAAVHPCEVMLSSGEKGALWNNHEHPQDYNMMKML